MSKCPNCDSEIDYLKEYQSTCTVYTYDGEDYDEIDSFAEDTYNDYECPICSTILFTDERKAHKFLKG